MSFKHLLLRWFPWRYLVSRTARQQGFIDPIALLARLRRFTQPSEVAEPIELLRAGVSFHARGLVNTRALQHNLDWVWPFWVARQFDPADESFLPRAFSVTHVNLTHRNWTAVGLPDIEPLAIVDPRGLVTPHLDGWSLDAWVVPAAGDPLLPSQLRAAEQRLELGTELSVVTQVAAGGAAVTTRAQVRRHGSEPYLEWQLDANSATEGWLVVALRPANPEGVSFIHAIEWSPKRQRFRIDDKDEVQLRTPPERVVTSNYHTGDVLHRLREPDAGTEEGVCDVGLASAAALYPVGPESPARVEVRVPLPRSSAGAQFPGPAWGAALGPLCRLQVPDAQFQFLYDAALRTLVLLCPGDVHPGPYTYRRFWFRDAAFMLDALLKLGAVDRVSRALERFPERQRRDGYFCSQEGEWDSNGQVLWLLNQFRRYTRRPLHPSLVATLGKGADWIVHKRLAEDSGEPHAGLLPAGFSAEHLGMNDYYFWDDFWGVAGLHAAADLLEGAGRDRDTSERLRAEAKRFAAAVERAVEGCATVREGAGIPAAPGRRMDAGAVGSLVASYPLRLWQPRDPRLLATAQYLLDECQVHGGFYQEMVHSGVNAYLTLHLAQVLLRAGDPRALELVQAVADLASPTGQWPEAIHPRTRGGCMGDGQHGWAAAEWALAMRALVVREEDDRLVLGSGVPAAWLDAAQPVRLGPTATPWGPVTVTVGRGPADAVRVTWDGQWWDAPPPIEVALPGRAPVAANPAAGMLELPPEDTPTGASS